MEATNNNNGAESADFIWQDRDIRFDSKGPLLDCRKGETVIDSINR